MNHDRKNVGDPRPNKSRHLNWEMLAILGFVILTFAGLIIALYVIWAKCNSN